MIAFSNVRAKVRNFIKLLRVFKNKMKKTQIVDKHQTTMMKIKMIIYLI